MWARAGWYGVGWGFREGEGETGEGERKDETGRRGGRGTPIWISSEESKQVSKKQTSILGQ